MIRGCSKRVIVLKQPPGDSFEEAYFIVKEGKYKSGRDTKTLLGEANKIINNDAKKVGKRRVGERVLNVFFFLLGAVCSFIIFYI